MNILGKSLLAAATCGVIFAAAPASAQAWKYDTQRAARQQETAAAQRMDYQIGEANAYGTHYPNMAPGRIDSYEPLGWEYDAY